MRALSRCYPPTLRHAASFGRASAIGPKARALHQIDPRSVPPRPRESPIPRHQWRTERFRQGDVGGVVGRDPGPELPDAPKQRRVWVAPNGKIGELRDCSIAALRADLSRGAKPSDRLGYFEIEQARGVQRPGTRHTPPHRLGAQCPQQELDHGRSVKHDHRASRNLRMTEAGDSRSFTGSRCRKRSRNSLTVG